MAKYIIREVDLHKLSTTSSPQTITLESIYILRVELEPKTRLLSLVPLPNWANIKEVAHSTFKTFIVTIKRVPSQTKMVETLPITVAKTRITTISTFSQSNKAPHPTKITSWSPPKEQLLKAKTTIFSSQAQCVSPSWIDKTSLKTSLPSSKRSLRWTIIHTASSPQWPWASKRAKTSLYLLEATFYPQTWFQVLIRTLWTERR